MTRRLFSLLLCAILLAGCAPDRASGQTLPVTDDTGTTVQVPLKPKKTAVLLSSLADLWITAGGRVDITVGESVERGFGDPEAILVDDGAGKSVNLEALIAAQPELVLYSSDIAGQLEVRDALLAAGIPAIGFSVETFDDYLRLLDICTRILDTPDRYRLYGEDIREEVDALIAAAGSQPQPKILFVRAGSSARFTKAKNADNHFVCRMLQDLGAENIADSAPVLLDGLSTEAVLLADPDFILFTTMGEEAAGEAYMESLLADPVWQTITAVKTGKVCQLPKELFQYKPNHRWAEAYTYLIRILYGDIL